MVVRAGGPTRNAAATVPVNVVFDGGCFPGERNSSWAVVAWTSTLGPMEMFQVKALLIIDMQAAMLERSPHEIDDVVGRINDLARVMREGGGLVVFVQHHGHPTDVFAPGRPGWQILPSLQQEASDLVVSKTVCDAFCDTRLDAVLKQHDVDELFVTGWATDYCVDTTVRAAASLAYDMTIVSDAHTVEERSHLDAKSIIQHHNVTWAGLDVPGNPIRVAPAKQVIGELQSRISLRETT